MERVNTSIPGLDRLTEGGFPRGSCVLVSGEAGTGKTILGMQFLYDGATKAREPGVLLQTEEFSETLALYEKAFGWDLREVQSRKNLQIIAFRPKDYDKFTPLKIEGEMLSKLRNTFVPMNTKRVVIDSITPLRMSLEDIGAYRKSLYSMVSFFKELGITSMLISEGSDVEEHMCDGVLKIRNREQKTGEFTKELMVAKMVATNAPRAWYPVTISEKLGFSVRPFR